MKIAILGAGAAGFFSAINIKEFFPKHEVDILEKSDKVLRKVRISGGGRCNVTHSCFQVEDLIKNYPRGQKELRSAFHIFQPENTIQWFAKRGVKLHTEEDGRMFPVSNSSETIVNCFLEEIKKKQINLLTEMKLQGIFREGDSFLLQSEEGFQKKYDRVLFATGSDRTSWKWLTALGHSIIEPIPSLFSFHIHDESLQSLQGLSIDKLSLSLEEKKYRQSGSLLFTHEGLSGPAVLKLSSFAAPYFHDKQYNTKLFIHWLGDKNLEEIRNVLTLIKIREGNKKVKNTNPPEIPTRAWEMLCDKAGIEKDTTWPHLSKKQFQTLQELLYKTEYKICGKSTFKDEFVTCGGVHLKEVDFKTMQSKLIPGIYFAGEVLNIDGITGGFNFQNAWTGAYIAALNIGKP